MSQVSAGWRVLDIHGEKSAGKVYGGRGADPDALVKTLGSLAAESAARGDLHWFGRALDLAVAGSWCHAEWRGRGGSGPR